jgi:uncharacterized membrane protein YbjE (DUF340 family)
MVYIAIICLVAGVLCGHFWFSSQTADLFSLVADYSLYLLMLSVGISVGLNKLIFRKLREYNLSVLLIPLGIVIGSVAGGFLCGLIFHMPMNASVSVTSGLGWYSLSGVLIGNLDGAEAGALAFLSNLLREIFSFILIPFIVKHFNPYTAIAPAGATSEDTTLPMMIKYTSEEVVVISVLNGVICSALVPVLINFFYQIL